MFDDTNIGLVFIAILFGEKNLFFVVISNISCIFASDLNVSRFLAPVRVGMKRESGENPGQYPLL